MNEETAVNLAIDNLLAEGPTDIFFRPFEIDLLTDPENRRKVFDHIAAKLKKRDFTGLAFQQIQHILVPKSRVAYDYRRAALMQPLCTLKYLSLVLLAAEKIEKSRLPLGDNAVFSYRFEPHGRQLFSESAGYNAWMLETSIRKQNRQTCRVVVKCDIASFYDRVNLHRLESTLQDLKVEPWIISTINKVLMHWSTRDSYGLPIGSNASRILAEAALIDVDRFLKQEDVRFTRYVDDFRLFAPDFATAQKWFTKLTSRLFKEGLLLNAAKTSFVDATKADVPPREVPKDDVEEVLRSVTKPGGYNRIPRRFQMPSSDKYQAFLSINLGSEVQQLANSTLVEFESIQRILIGAMVQQQWSLLANAPDYLPKCAYGIDYIIDMLIKNRASIPPPTRHTISQKMTRLLQTGLFRGLDWYESRIVHLLTIPEYSDRVALVDYVRCSPKDNSTLPTSVALNGLVHDPTRTEAKTLRDLFPKCDGWEKRRIIKIVASALPPQERDAWLRVINPTIADDLFATLVVTEAQCPRPPDGKCSTSSAAGSSGGPDAPSG
jgi:hypothetical protein